MNDYIEMSGTAAGGAGAGTAWSGEAALINPEPWMADAFCAETDPEAFFPDKGGTTKPAKTICSSCAVQAECLEYALTHDERFGIWGGLSERERRRVKKGAAA